MVPWRAPVAVRVRRPWLRAVGVPPLVELPLETIAADGVFRPRMSIGEGHRRCPGSPRAKQRPRCSGELAVRGVCQMWQLSRTPGTGRLLLPLPRQAQPEAGEIARTATGSARSRRRPMLLATRSRTTVSQTKAPSTNTDDHVVASWGSKSLPSQRSQRRLRDSSNPVSGEPGAVQPGSSSSIGEIARHEPHDGAARPLELLTLTAPRGMVGASLVLAPSPT